MRPIRILQQGLSGGWGGIECLVMEAYRRIDRDRVQFDFLMPCGIDRIAFEDEVAALGGRVFRELRAERDDPFGAQARLLAWMRRHAEIGGVHVHANYPYALPLKAAKRAGIRLRVLHAHNAGSSDALIRRDALRRTLRGMLDARARRQMTAYPTHYLACSGRAADYMFPGRPYRLLPNGIDTRRFAFDAGTRAAVRSRLGLAESTAVIGFCGGLRMQKNPLFLAEIFAAYHGLHPDSALLVVGDGVLRGPMERRLRALGAWEAARFVGARPDTAPYYQAMDAFVLPSHYEGLGMVAVEAQCAGLPCLLSAEGVPGEASITADACAASLREPAVAWARRLETPLAARMRRAGRDAAVRAAGYDIDATARRLQDLYVRQAGRDDA